MEAATSKKVEGCHLLLGGRASDVRVKIGGRVPQFLKALHVPKLRRLFAIDPRTRKMRKRVQVHYCGGRHILLGAPGLRYQPHNPRRQ